ncbi:MAG: AmmeMemoRadiSam system radical SAM enzyme [Planctomycetaceae bacterium]|jgi:pyruvate formate lyase activating enzyme|nr:AmmeMemoRadiSam system radical SAM enzyme [Planctomycetaceae bacterium]
MNCPVCPRRCSLSDNQAGFCGVRRNVQGKVVQTTAGRTTGFAADPIEKKPLFHFYPGSSVLSFGSIGCNFACRFCQNASTARSCDTSLLTEPVAPQKIAELAKQHHCIGVAFTYNEPVISAEYVQDVAAACRENGLKTIAVSNGYISDAVRPAFFSAMDAANIDLKSFSEDFYQNYCQAALEPVKETLRYLAKSPVWLEVTTLLIPTLNDSGEEIAEMSHWIADELGLEIPLHFSAYHPTLQHAPPPTPPSALFEARNIAMSAGLRFVYTGNIRDTAGEATLCPQCGQTVIARNRYSIEEYRIDEDGCCSFCGQTISGCFPFPMPPVGGNT